MGTPITRLIDVPAGWEQGGSFFASFDGANLLVIFGDDAELPRVAVRFEWVRSFRYVSEATYDTALEVIGTEPLLSELPLPDPRNPSNDYYGDVPEVGKGPPRLFRMFHYKAGLIDVVASNWNEEGAAR